MGYVAAQVMTKPNLSEKLLTASVCRVAEDVVSMFLQNVCTYPSNCGITSQNIGVLKMFTVRTPNCLFLSSYYFFFNSKVKVQQLNSKTFHVLFPFQVLFKDKLNVTCKLIRYALCSFQLDGYLLSLCRTRFQKSSFYGNISTYTLNAMVPDSVTVETLCVTT